MKGCIEDQCNVVDFLWNSGIFLILRSSWKEIAYVSINVLMKEAGSGEYELNIRKEISEREEWRIT